MADRRPADQEMSRAKRMKTDLDSASNPYLAHMYEGNEEGSYGNGYNQKNGTGNFFAKNSSLSKFRRHGTTAAQAHDAEDGPDNPLNGQPLSKQYFGILKTRRDLPVHRQRLVIFLQRAPFA